VSDPLLWVGAVIGVLFGIAAALSTAGSQQGVSFALVALAGLFSGVVWWALATFVPAGIRLLIWRRHRAALLERRPPAIEAGWYPDPTDLTRYRWWDGSKWAAEVNPAPSARSVGAAGPVVLGAAAAAVVVGSLLIAPASVNPVAGGAMDAATAEQALEDLQSFMPSPDELQDELASQFPSPSPEASALFDAKLSMDLAKAYGRMTEALYEANDLSAQPGDTVEDLFYSYGRKIRKATDEWRSFNRLLGQVRKQEQIGDYPPLDLLRRVESRVSWYLKTAEQISRSFLICLSGPEAELTACVESSRAVYEAKSEQQFKELDEAVKELADAREGQKS